MARLPTVGGDSDQWGAILNQFLQVSLKDDGTLKGVLTGYNVKDFGAAGDGTTDDTAAIQSAIDAAISAGGGTVLLPVGTYKITSTLKFTGGVSNIGFKGGAPIGETGKPVSLVWSGAAGGNVIYINQVRDSCWEDFSILNGSTSYGVGIYLDQTVTSGDITTNNTFREIEIPGGTTCGMYCGNPTTNNNNDEHKFWNVRFKGDTTKGIGGGGSAGLIIENQNAKGYLIYGGNFAYKAIGIRCKHGSFHCVGTNFESNTADIQLEGATDTISCHALQSENSTKFLDAQWTSVAWAIQVTGSRLAPGASATEFITLHNGGPLTIMNCDFASASYDPAMRLGAIGGSLVTPVMNLIGNVFPNPSVLATCQECVVNAVGNRYYDSSTNLQQFDDRFGPIASSSALPKFIVGKHFVLQADIVRSNQAPAFTSTYTPDPTLGEFISITLSGDLSVNAPKNATQGQTLTFIWRQDGTGGRTIHYDPVFRTGGGVGTSTAAGTTTIDRFFTPDGSSWRLISRITGQP